MTVGKNEKYSPPKGSEKEESEHKKENPIITGLKFK